MEQQDPLQRFNQVLLAILLFFGLLYLGSEFLILIAIAGLLAMLLVPACQKLEKWRFSRTLAAFICVFAIVILLAGVMTMLISQIIGLANDLPELGQTLSDKLDLGYSFVKENFDVSRAEQNEYLQAQLSRILQSVGGYISSFLLSTGTFLVNFIIIITFALLFLLYRRRIKNFILQLTWDERSQARSIVNKITGVASSYIAGVFLVVLILATINTIGLIVIGIEHALFFGLLAGLLNIIPYIGSLAGSLVPVLFAFLTKDSLWYPLIVAIFFLIVQQIESYILTPQITGSKIKLSPMSTLMALLVGGMIWGVAGMILFVPYLGIVKVIFDNIDPLKPFGYIIGTDEG